MLTMTKQLRAQGYQVRIALQAAGGVLAPQPSTVILNELYRLEKHHNRDKA